MNGYENTILKQDQNIRVFHSWHLFSIPRFLSVFLIEPWENDY